ncbi:universal stress protein [Prauserella muralis]|uniref:Universal stress protein n=1 Tax=Prauserella muralis TaxID=588067 RepID=A0A2V4ANJ2_9PSEU|nr:universal stress protein [Prauserella muralis]PXY22270.1 universal stress protein [Prauserella muralis]TWE27911.1 nucleotide-binding universal stress UspA family protein [Prauserella muralis]
MSTQGSVTGKVVVGIDGSEASTQATRWAARLAAQRELPLYIVHAYGLLGRYYGELPISSGVFEAVEDEAKTLVSAAAEAARAEAPGVEVEAVVIDEPPVTLLIKLSREARFVVLGASGLGGFAGMLAGSTAVGLAGHGECPVVIVRHREGQEQPPADGPVVVGVDGSPVSERAIAAAFEEASFRGAPLVAVHAWLDVEYESAFNRARVFFEGGPLQQDEERLLAERLAGWQEKYPDVAVERVLAKDRPKHELLERSATAQLVVVGSRGRGGVAGMLLGSTSQTLLHHAQCPVMIVRPGKNRD